MAEVLDDGTIVPSGGGSGTTSLPRPGSFVYTVVIDSVVLPEGASGVYSLFVNVSPSIPTFELGKVEQSNILRINPIPLHMYEAFMTEVTEQIKGKIESYFDHDRQLKTLLNFGNEYQSVMVNWKYDDSDSTPDMFVKLYRPLPPEITIKTPVYISREITPPLLDKVFVYARPPEIAKYYLRPKFISSHISRQTKESYNQTLETLLSSGAFYIDKPEDRITEEWFTTALEGAELNVEYSNFRNFIFFGSAQRRLEAFKNKLLLIESYDRVINNHSASFSAMVSSSAGTIAYTASLAYPAIYEMGLKRQDLIRSFDGYERFLYYDSGSGFSGSFAQYPDDQDVIYDYEDMTWPKIAGVVQPVASSSVWYNSASLLASEYDNWNVNKITNNIPEYIVSDTDSSDYVKFFDMTGHMFDIVKLYIDNMSNIFDRTSDPNSGLSPDIVWNIANSFGTELPNQYAIESLVDYALGAVSGSADPRIYQMAAAETWKRFLHNQIHLLKSKGTKESLKTLMNSYGVLPTTIYARESSTPSYYYSSSVWELFDENTIAADVSASYIRLPWFDVTLLPKTFQIRFSTLATGSNMTLVNDDTNTWSIKLVPSAVTASYHQIQVLSGSTILMSSSYLQVATGEFYNIQLQRGTGANSSSTFYLRKDDGNGEFEVDITVSESSNRLTSVWDSSTWIYAGGSSLTFDGLIDEVRVWGEYTTEEVFENWALYPGLYNGNTSSSARDYLWSRLSFNTPKNLGIAPFTIQNESPYARTLASSSAWFAFSASGFLSETSYPYSMDVLPRTVRRLSPMAGGLSYDTNKIYIEPAPTLVYLSGSSVPVLSRNQSIVKPIDLLEKDTVASNTIAFYFSLTNAINDSIIRSMGQINIHDYIGDPRYLYSSSYNALNALNQQYWNNYSYRFDINALLKFTKDILNPMFDQARDIIPAKSNLITGFVVEPHMLERYRYPMKKIIKDDQRLEADATTTEPDNVEAEYTDFSSLIRYEDENVIDATYTDFTGILDAEEEYVTPSSLYTDYQGVVNTHDEVITLDPEYTDYTDTINLYTILETARRTASSSLKYDDAYIPTYTSLCDLDLDIGATTYFTHPLGYVGIKAYDSVRLYQSILTNMGAWNANTMYNRHQYVTYEDIEYYAIKSSFISALPPSEDVYHWRRVGYTPTSYLSIRKAVLINEELTLIPTSSSPVGATVVQGYLKQHYIYFKPTYTAFNRARYTGCLQTIDTTTDGESPVEVLRSATDVLVVRDSTAPIQRRDDLSGPILDVK